MFFKSYIFIVFNAINTIIIIIYGFEIMYIVENSLTIAPLRSL